MGWILELDYQGGIITTAKVYQGKGTPVKNILLWPASSFVLSPVKPKDMRTRVVPILDKLPTRACNQRVQQTHGAS
jgi:hypothetical protein